jgi:hypothetical protein
MPSKSEAQRRFMSAAAHSPDFAKKAGIPQSVAQEFHAADAGKSYGAGQDKEAKRRKIAAALKQ